MYLERPPSPWRRGVNGGDKADHSAAQIPAIGRAASGMTRALTR
jgi:hypothetical protein